MRQALVRTVVVAALGCSLARSALAADNLYTTPTSLNFYDQLVGRRSHAETLMITSTQGVMATANFTFSNSAFAQVAGPTPPFTLFPGGTGTIQIACTPQQLGPNDGTVTITLEIEGFITDTVTVPLMCSGRPALSIYSMPAFGYQRVGESKSNGLHLGNIGQPTITISSMTITGPDAADFALTLPPLPLTLTSGNSVGGQLTFTPSREGLELATLEILSDDALQPMRSIPLSGTGYEQHLMVSATAVEFDTVVVGASASLPITLTNLDSTPQELSLSLSGANATRFAVDTTMLSIPGGASRIVNVSYSPDAFRYAEGSLAIVPTIPPLEIALNGAGTAADLELSPKPLEFESTPIGSRSPLQTVTLTNHSDEAVPIRQIAATDRAFLVEAPVPALLAKGESLTFTIGFAPTQVGPHRADVRVYVGDYNWRAATAAVSGEGEMEIDSAGASGCNAGGSASLLVLALFAPLRRRRLS